LGAAAAAPAIETTKTAAQVKRIMPGLEMTEP
jgi:hypothetical protein